MSLKHDVQLTRLVARPVMQSLVVNFSDRFRAATSRHRYPRIARTCFDPMDPATAADPYPGYRELLAGPRVHYNQRRNIFLLSRFGDVREAARNDSQLSNIDGVVAVRFRLPVLLHMDRPRHTDLRKKAHPAFTRGSLAAWEPIVEQLAEELVSDLLANPGADVVERLAVPLPMRMIAQILGVAPEDEPFFRHWSNEAVRVANVQPTLGGMREVPCAVNGARHLHAYLMSEFERGNLLGSETLLGKLVDEAGEGQISRDELFCLALLLLLAGNETTTNLLSTMFLTLSDNPDQFEAVRSNPGLIPGAVEEQLRYSSPIQCFYRTAARDYPVGDATIPAGARVALLWGAANRDPREFDNPDAFVATRKAAQHVAFGSGIHLCLGAGLARMEGQAVLRQLVNRVRRVEVVGEPVWTTNSSLRGLRELPVCLVRADR